MRAFLPFIEAPYLPQTPLFDIAVFDPRTSIAMVHDRDLWDLSAVWTRNGAADLG
jgi:hypothetical protein